MKYAITMKPTALAKNYGKARGAEYLLDLEADDRNHAAAEARKTADLEGYRGYAITKITAVPQ